MSFTIVALYKFIKLIHPSKTKDEITTLCQNFEILGGLILAYEGINGTVAGPTSTINLFLSKLCDIIPIEDHEIKFSTADINPFYRLRMQLKPEIITMGCPNVDPLEKKGVYVDSIDWNKLISDPEVLLIDTRNTYEIELGTFKNAVNPNCVSFRDFPNYVTTQLDPSVHKKVAMFCTGGVRCEKASNYMLNKGFDEVYHLKGGILKYLEEFKKEEDEDVGTSLWQGECYVFDQRVSVGHGLKPGTYALCRACRHPLAIPSETTEEIITENGEYYYEEGVSCRYCYYTLSIENKAAAKERHLQIKLAKERNMKHLGYQESKHITRDNKSIVVEMNDII